MEACPFQEDIADRIQVRSLRISQIDHTGIRDWRLERQIKDSVAVGKPKTQQ